MTPTVAPTSLALPALTGIRFIAAVWVLGYHLTRPWLSTHEGVLRNVVAGAPIALTTFFLLSGFVLTWVYSTSALPRLNRRAFAAARISRVVPIYVLAVLVAVPIGVIARSRGIVDDGYTSLLFVATGTQAWVPSAALEWNPPLWSVSVEIAFYVAFPLLLPRVLRARTSTLVLIGAIFWAASIACGVAYIALDPDGVGLVRPETQGTWLHVLRFNPLVRFPDLFTGMVAARLFLDGKRLPSFAGVAAALVILVALASGVVPVPLLHGSLFAPLAAVLIVALATSTGPIARVLSTRVMQRLGDTSYALYALHIPVWFWMAGLTKRKLDDTSLGFTVAVAITAIVVAIAAHVLIEKPMRDRVRKWIA